MNDNPFSINQRLNEWVFLHIIAPLTGMKVHNGLSLAEYSAAISAQRKKENPGLDEMNSLYSEQFGPNNFIEIAQKTLGIAKQYGFNRDDFISFVGNYIHNCEKSDTPGRFFSKLEASSAIVNDKSIDISDASSLAESLYGAVGEDERFSLDEFSIHYDSICTDLPSYDECDTSVSDYISAYDALKAIYNTTKLTFPDTKNAAISAVKMTSDTESYTMEGLVTVMNSLNNNTTEKISAADLVVYSGQIAELTSNVEYDTDELAEIMGILRSSAAESTVISATDMILCLTGVAENCSEGYNPSGLENIAGAFKNCSNKAYTLYDMANVITATAVKAWNASDSYESEDLAELINGFVDYTKKGENLMEIGRASAGAVEYLDGTEYSVNDFVTLLEKYHKYTIAGESVQDIYVSAVSMFRALEKLSEDSDNDNNFDYALTSIDEICSGKKLSSLEIVKEFYKKNDIRLKMVTAPEMDTYIEVPATKVD
jgi:hypothetical protein